MAKPRAGKSRISAMKAREILHDGTVHGKPLTPRQRRFMGVMAFGKPMRSMKHG